MRTEIIHAHGHKNVLSTHGKTFEFTRDDHLTPRGDCIVAVSADLGCADLSKGFKDKLRKKDALLEIKIECDGISDVSTARGHPDLQLTHETDLVVRKSDFICSRTLAIRADKAACELNRELIDKLKQGQPAIISLTMKEESNKT